MDFEQNKVSQDDLENVSGGGEIIETKDGKFFIRPYGAKSFDTEEAAKKYESTFKRHIHIPEVAYGCPRTLQKLPIEIKKSETETNSTNK